MERLVLLLQARQQIFGVDRRLSFFTRRFCAQERTSMPIHYYLIPSKWRLGVQMVFGRLAKGKGVNRKYQIDC